MVPSARQCAASIVVIAALVAGCTRESNQASDATAVTTPATTAPIDRSDNSLTIGVLLPETGDGATLGGPIREAIDAQVVSINNDGGVLNNPVEVFYADEARTQGLDELLDMLTRDGRPVDAIIGPASSRVALRSLGQIVRSPNPVPVCSPSATALSLDDYKDDNWFFRTVPSDSLLMAAMAKSAQLTGQQDVAVIYLDDPYGRGLSDAFVEEVESRGKLEVTSNVGVDRELTDADRTVRDVLRDEPGIVVVLADDAVGGGVLAAINEQVEPGQIPQILVNDSVRTARQSIESLSESVRQKLSAIAPMATFDNDGQLTAPFAVEAVDCVNLFALATELAGSDRPSDIRSNIQSASVGGVPCRDYTTCSEFITNGRTIDYTPVWGPVDLGATGDPLSGKFEMVGFMPNGTEEQRRTLEAP